eukprot:TRINITY_DN2754_c0_g1_i1.p1 TRINITY_DN2754_c0_g1~~TRINITY_DN2754_c0_g1_i1.p1  ORF type:complete len:550 (-),score=87.97 TRINITY_DN2754_c0_g1_i1:119-1768(-)
MLLVRPSVRTRTPLLGARNASLQSILKKLDSKKLKPKQKKKMRKLNQKMAGLFRTLMDDVEGSGILESEVCCSSLKQAGELNHVNCMVHLMKKTSNPEGYTLLHVACTLKAPQTIPVLIGAYGIDPNQPSNKGVYPIHIAVSKGCAESVGFLIDKGADPKVTDREGYSVIYWALKEPNDNSEAGTGNLVSYFMKDMTQKQKEHEIFYRGKTNGLSALHLAAENGHWQFLHLVLHEGFSILQTTSTGKNVLHMACDSQDSGNVIQYILQLDTEIIRALVKQYDNIQRLPLHYYSSHGSFDIFCELLVHCQDLVDCADEQGNTPLHMACAEGNLNVALALTKAGAWVEAENNEGVRPLHFAVKFMTNPDIPKEHEKLRRPSDITMQEILERDISFDNLPNMEAVPELVQLLVTHGNVNARSQGGDSALHMAVYEGALHNVAYLLQQGANPNFADSQGNTPLHIAAFEGWITICLLLLKHGGSVNEYNAQNQTALHIAMAQGHWGVSYYLLIHGANFEAETTDGVRPIHLLCEVAKCGPPQSFHTTRCTAEP